MRVCEKKCRSIYFSVSDGSGGPYWKWPLEDRCKLDRVKDTDGLSERECKGAAEKRRHFAGKQTLIAMQRTMSICKSSIRSNLGMHCQFIISLCTKNCSWSELPLSILNRIRVRASRLICDQVLLLSAKDFSDWPHAAWISKIRKQKTNICIWWSIWAWFMCVC